MKKISLLLLLFLVPMVASTQTKRTIHVATAGTLPNLISEDEKYQIEELTLTGELNGTDFKLIRDMAGVSFYFKNYQGAFYPETSGILKSLNLSNADIVNGGEGYVIADEGSTYFNKTRTVDPEIYSFKYTKSNCISTLLFFKTKLKLIILPQNVTTIEDGAFKDCGVLTSIDIPNSVTSIGYEAFSGCSSLTSFTIPNSVTSIGNYAFSGCSSLTSVTIPNSVTSIGSYAFSDCSGLTSIKVESGNEKYDSRNNSNAIIETSSNTLIRGCKNTIIPNSVKSIGNYAFNFCSGLTSITIPNSVTSIGKSAFSGCYNLTSVTIGSNVTSIGDYAFNGCSGLTSVTIPNSVTSIGWDAFRGCSGLTSVTIPNSVTSIGDNAFSGCSGLTSVTIPNSVTSIGYEAFSGCSSLTSVTIPNSVTSIGNGAFDETAWYNNQPDGLVYAGKVAYEYKGDMPENTSITIKDGTVGIADNAFYGCSGLAFVTIPNSVTSIGGGAFMWCTSLTSITIPNSVTSIGDYAFCRCSGLTSIVSLNSNPPSVQYSDAFSNVDKNNCVVGVPKGSLSAYKGANGWKDFANIVEIGSVGFTFEVDGINYEIGENNTVSVVSKNSKYSGDYVIPNQVSYLGTTYTVTSIGSDAFNGCSALTSVTIGNSVTSIGNNAFYGCNNLKYICLASDKYPASSSLGNTTCQYIMHQSAFDAGIPQDITDYATYTVAPKYITVKSTTATTATLELTPIDLTGGSTEDATPYEVTMYGLNPGSSVMGSWELETKDRGLASIPTVTTKNLVMNVQPAQPTSKIKARLVATVNEPDDDQHFGFEWLRYDAPSIMTPNKVSAPLYKGQIVGSLNNLDPNVYYKYRPYYKSAGGSMFYGEWEAFITGDADVFFEPETHTKEASEVTGESAQLAGSWIEGTEDTEEKGFEYWQESSASTRATGENMIRVIVDGNQTTATVDGLMAGKVYGYHSYVKTASGTTYGEDKTFKTPLPGDANDNGVVDAADIVELVNAMAGHPSASFNLNNADANADGSFTEADITATADIIMKR